MAAGAGAGHGGQGGQRGHVALPALGRPEAQPRLGALVRVGGVVPEQAAAAPSVADISVCRAVGVALTERQTVGQGRCCGRVGSSSDLESPVPQDVRQSLRDSWLSGRLGLVSPQLDVVIHHVVTGVTDHIIIIITGIGISVSCVTSLLYSHVHLIVY